MRRSSIITLIIAAAAVGLVVWMFGSTDSGRPKKRSQPPAETDRRAVDETDEDDDGDGRDRKRKDRRSRKGGTLGGDEGDLAGTVGDEDEASQGAGDRSGRARGTGDEAGEGASGVDSGESEPAHMFATQVEGRVRYAGKAPEPTVIDMSSDPRCAKVGRPEDKLRESGIHDGSVAETVVYIANPPDQKFKVPSSPVPVKLERCRYRPSVFAGIVGQKLELQNMDATLHAIQIFGEPEMAVGMPVRGQRVLRPLPAAGRVELGCSVHEWETGTLAVFGHPFWAITGKDGYFSIRGLPEGEYRLVAWNPRLKVETVQKVTVKGSTSIEVVLGEVEN